MTEQQTLELLYERYMACVQANLEAQAVWVAARNALQERPEYQALETAHAAYLETENAASGALEAVKFATVMAFQATGERQPHPYAGIIRVDQKPQYEERMAFEWVKARPDYRYLIIPESLNRKGFEKLVRHLVEGGMTPKADNQGLGETLVEWLPVPVASVKIREDA